VGSADGEVGKSNWKLRLCVGLLPTNPMKTRQTVKKAEGLNQKKKRVKERGSTQGETDLLALVHLIPGFGVKFVFQIAKSRPRKRAAD